MTSRTSTQVTIHARNVEIGEIVSSPSSTSEAQSEGSFQFSLFWHVLGANTYATDDDVQQLIPWPFLTVEALEEESIWRWPRDQRKFKEFFSYFESHLLELEELKISDGLEYADGETSGVPMEKFAVVLPRKSWHEPAIRKEAIVRDNQSAMLCYLFHDIICGGLEVSQDLSHGCELK